MNDKGAERTISLLISDLPKVNFLLLFLAVITMLQKIRLLKNNDRTLEISKYFKRSAAKLEKN